MRFPGKKTHCTLRIARETNAHRMYLERNTACVTMTISTENHCATIVHLIAAINAFHNYILSAIFVIPLRLVLCTAKSFVVISLHFEQLFKVRFAIKFSLQSSIISKSQSRLALRTLKAGLVEHLLVSRKSLHWINSLATRIALLLLWSSPAANSRGGGGCI